MVTEVLPSRQTEPAGHVVQSESDVKLVSSVYVPAGHGYWSGYTVPAGQ